MKLETLVPGTGVTPVAPETGNGTETPNVQVDNDPKPEVTVDTPQVSEVENIELDAKDPKPTFDKLRNIAEESNRALKNSLSEIAALKEQLKDRETKDAEAKGEYERLYRESITEIAELKQKVSNAEKQLSSHEKDTLKLLKPLNDALNEMLDLNMKDWSDEAKAAIDPVEQLNAADRLKQYKKIAPLVTVKKNSAAAVPGITPSPKDAREELNEKPNDDNANALYSRLQRQLNYG